MGDEAVNGVNTGVCGRFMACGWGCVGYDKGRGKKWGLNGVEKGMTWRWKMTEMEALAETGASLFVCCGLGGKRGDFVVISDLGIHLDIQFGNSPLKVWEFKKWK